MAKSEAQQGGAAVFLTAPKDIQNTADYERALERVRGLHPGQEVVADRDLFTGNADYESRWKDVYSRAAMLYVLAREDGTVGVGIFKQCRRLAKRGVGQALFFAGDFPTLYEGFELSPLEEPADGMARHATVAPTGDPTRLKVGS